MSGRRPALLLIALALAACAPAESEVQAPRRTTRSAPIVFAYGTPSGGELGSASTRGRVTALLFVTTFDLPSQVMARRLDEVIRHHRPRANAGAVVVEAPNAAPLVDVFRSTLGLSYEVGLSATGDERNGPFGSIDSVPTLVVLDERGREVSRSTGVSEASAIENALAEAER